MTNSLNPQFILNFCNVLETQLQQLPTILQP